MTDVVKRQVDSKPTLTQNISAERAVLAGIAQYGSAVHINVSDILTDECFTDKDNQLLYKVFREILKNAEKIDISSIFTIGASLGVNLETPDHTRYIRSLFNFQTQQENVRKNATVLRKLDIIRKGQRLARSMHAELLKLNGTESISDILSKIEGPAYDFGNLLAEQDTQKTKLMGEGVLDFIKHLKENKGATLGIPSPFPRYNELIGGGRRRGGVYLTAARPKTGKSTCAINDALHVAGVLNIPVLYLDSEMGEEGQWPRILSNLSLLKIKEIESGSFAEVPHQETKLLEAGKKLEGMPFYYRRIAGKEFDEVISIMRRWILQEVGQENGRSRDCLIIYDYFKLMTASSLEEMQEFQALGFQMQAMTDFCQNYDVSCSAYVQVNRDGINKETSDIISQSDRLLWFCSSIAIFKRKTAEEMALDGPEQGNIKLIPTQDQRYGAGLEEGDYINLLVDKERGIISEKLTAFELKKTQANSGFDTVEPEDDEQVQY